MMIMTMIITMTMLMLMIIANRHTAFSIVCPATGTYHRLHITKSLRFLKRHFPINVF